MNLNLQAWELWVAYRKELRKPVSQKRPISFAAAQRKLASFGDDQMAVVQRSMENGWQGLFPLPAPSKTEAKNESVKIEWQNLRERAQQINFRLPRVGEDLLGYKTLLERAEYALPRRASVVHIGDLFRRKA